MITGMVRAFRKKLQDGTVHGVFSKTSDPAFIEIMGLAGFDFVILDLEHGPNSVQTAVDLMRAAEGRGLLPVVRTQEDNLSIIGEALDAGAGGIQVPQVASPGFAEEVLRAAKFAPRGARGVCRFVRAADYSALDRFRYFREANETIVILQLEGIEALEKLEGIIAVPDVDVIFIGPYDLSQSLGVPGLIDHPIVAKEMETIVERCAARGIAVGTYVDTVETARKWSESGVRYIACSVDVGIFYESCRQLVSRLRGI